jgi:seryl-tRNA synthetase
MNTSFPQSAPVRDALAMAAFARIDSAIQRVAAELGAEEMQYPTLISREALVKAGYPAAFPHLLMLAAPLRDPQLQGETQLAATNLASPGFCLSPAVCYHVYASFAGRRLGEPRAITAGGRCFRNEAGVQPGRRQIEFEMREIVLLGPAEWVRATAGAARERLEQLARQLGMSGEWRPAEDPFFLPRARGQALIQRLKQTKLEYCLADDPEGLALASINFHDDFFGRRFDIRDADGQQFLHSACVAAGLDRWAHASCMDQHETEVTACHPSPPHHL